MRTVTAADANRQFSSVLREVAKGEVFTVLSRGKPVATIAPSKSSNVQRDKAKNCLLTRLRNQATTGVRHWTREELYSD